MGVHAYSINVLQAVSGVSFGWAYGRCTPNSGTPAAVFEHELGRWRVRSLFTKLMRQRDRLTITQSAGRSRLG